MATILITGANRGIGLEFVRQYRAQGDRVLAVVRDSGEATEAKALGADIHPLDLRDVAGITALAETLSGEAIDVLIANAGIYEGRDVTLDQTDPAWWLDAFRINAMAPLLLARAFLPHVRRGTQRKLVAISSRFASMSYNKVPGHYAYRTSKAALNAGWNGLAVEVPDVIAVLISPGHVRTRMS